MNFVSVLRESRGPTGRELSRAFSRAESIFPFADLPDRLMVCQKKLHPGFLKSVE